MSEEFTKKELEQYLEGKVPLHPERLGLPAEEELDAAEAEFDRIVAAKRKPARLIPLWPWAAAVAAVVIVLFIWRGNMPQSTENTGILASQEIVPSDTVKRRTRNLPSPHAEIAIAARGDCHRRSRRLEAPQQAPKTIAQVVAPVTIQHNETQDVPEDKTLPEEPVSREQTEETPVIPPDKQALADIFLAEEALQVAYELRAQQEAIRAYAASLNGKELPKPIIAF